MCTVLHLKKGAKYATLFQYILFYFLFNSLQNVFPGSNYFLVVYHHWVPSHQWHCSLFFRMIFTAGRHTTNEIVVFFFTPCFEWRKMCGLFKNFIPVLWFSHCKAFYGWRTMHRSCPPVTIQKMELWYFILITSYGWHIACCFLEFLFIYSVLSVAHCTTSYR